MCLVMTMATLADMNKEPRESDWQGIYRIRHEYRVGRYGRAGSHSHLIRIEIIVAELREHKPGTLKVGQLLSSEPICNSRRGQHGAQPLMEPRWGFDDITCAKCRERLGLTELRCIQCDKPLDPKKAVWLEWDTRLGGPSNEPIPAEHSQGSFPYGQDCASKHVIRGRND